MHNKYNMIKIQHNIFEYSFTLPSSSIFTKVCAIMNTIYHLWSFLATPLYGIHNSTHFRKDTTTTNSDQSLKTGPIFCPAIQKPFPKNGTDFQMITWHALKFPVFECSVSNMLVFYFFNLYSLNTYTTFVITTDLFLPWLSYFIKS